MNYDLIFYVYSQGILDFEGMPNLVMINIEENDFEIVPEKSGCFSERMTRFGS